MRHSAFICLIISVFLAFCKKQRKIYNPDNSTSIRSVGSNLKVALVSMMQFIKSINTQSPDVYDSTVKMMYEASKNKYRPKRTSRLKHIELLSIDEGGMSYWSNKTHRWIQGRFDKKKNIFIPPKKNL